MSPHQDKRKAKTDAPNASADDRTHIPCFNDLNIGVAELLRIKFFDFFLVRKYAFNNDDR